MPNKQLPKTQAPIDKAMPKKLKTTETGEFDIEGRENLGEQDSEETDFEVTGRESLIPKKDEFNKSKH